MNKSSLIKVWAKDFNNTRTVRFVHQYRLYVYPIILFLLLISLTAFKVSGTSIGVYYSYLYGQDIKDPNLIFGRPQSIRSDEWLVNTQLAVAQQKNGFHEINTNISGGKNMTVITDAPYFEWSELFKLQNLAFFVLPLEYAFAFKWWLILFVLLISVYIFSLRILPGKIWVAIASSLLVGFSPFIFWWYQTATIMPLAYGFLILTISMSIVKATPLRFGRKAINARWSAVIKTAALAYILIAFALLLYPPFQIPVGLVVALFMLGYVVDHLRGKAPRMWLKTSIPFVVAILTTAAVCGAFLITRANTISTIANTVYPGHRVSESGGYDAKKLLVTYLQPQLQRKSTGDKYFENQSEASSFVVMPMVFVVPLATWFVWLYVQKRRIDWTLAGLLACNVIFIAHMLVPLPLWLTKLFFLQLVPPQRVIIGLGMLGVINIIYFISLSAHNLKRISPKMIFAATGYAGLYFIVTLWAGLLTQSSYPGFIDSTKLLVLLNLILCGGFLLIFWRRYAIGMAILTLFTLGSVFHINPLYRGLGPLNNSELIHAVQSYSGTHSRWAVVDNLLIENVPQISNRSSITGVTFYPSNDLWKKYVGGENASIYNRYAHVLLSSKNTTEIKLVQPDLFTVRLQCERAFIDTVTNVLSTEPLIQPCLHLDRVVSYPAVNFYLYSLPSRS